MTAISTAALMVTALFLQAAETAFAETAWEQIAAVCVFAVTVIIILDRQAKQQREWQEFIAKQNANWQSAVNEYNNRWQIALKDQEAARQLWTTEQNKNVCENLQAVTGALKKLADQLDEHDRRVDDRVDSAAAHKPAPRPPVKR